MHDCRYSHSMLTCSSRRAYSAESLSILWKHICWSIPKLQQAGHDALWSELGDFSLIVKKLPDVLFFFLASSSSSRSPRKFQSPLKPWRDSGVRTQRELFLSWTNQKAEGWHGSLSLLGAVGIGPPSGTVWPVISPRQSGLVAEEVPPTGVTVSGKRKMCFSGILRKIPNPVPNPGIPVHFQHFAVLINTCCENLAKVRVTGIIWRIR